MATDGDRRYVVQQREIPRGWVVVRERQFTGNPDDPEGGGADQLDLCWEYMGHTQGRRRVVPS